MLEEDDVGFLFKTMIERDPQKRRVKPVESAQTSLLNFDLGGSSEDSDFRIEDHCGESDDDSVDTNDDESDDDDEDDNSSDSEKSMADLLIDKKNEIPSTLESTFEKAQELRTDRKGLDDDKLFKMLICCGCLGDRSDDVNEIVECDGCGVTVHEGCYGVSDVESFSSTDSLSQSAPWFCEACSAGITDPYCELCPNKGGIFKETDVGKWVHLVCALYVPGVAFGEVDRLSTVTLFEMAYNKWGAKVCSLCDDVRYAQTGVCIECDAGMCHSYFHVTCAQKEGLLSEAHSEEVDQADPFYAHCKLHSDKTLVRKRKRNWLTLQLRATHRVQAMAKPEYRETEEYLRVQRKLTKHRHKYLAHKASKSPAWIPTQKMSRLLTSSASAYRNLQHKAELIGVDIMALKSQEDQVVSLLDTRKKWHISPAFNIEFISYYLDRYRRIALMRIRLDELFEANTKLLDEQQDLDKKYDGITKLSEEQEWLYKKYKSKIEAYHRLLKSLHFNQLPAIVDMLKLRTVVRSDAMIKDSTAISPKTESPFHPKKSDGFDNQAVGQDRQSKSQSADLQVRYQCGICRYSTDQHLLTKCDTCQLHYHLSCLTPPLTRLPKKTKLMGWQCSECDKEMSDLEREEIDTSAPRRLRHYKEDSDQSQPIVREPDIAKSSPSMDGNAVIKKPPPDVFMNSNDNFEIVNTTHPTPKLTIKPMESLPRDVEPKKVDGAGYYDPHILNNLVMSFRENTPEYRIAPMDGVIDCSTSRSSKKRRREKHKRYTPDPLLNSKQRKRKRKRKNADYENPNDNNPSGTHRRITIKIKPIPLPESERIFEFTNDPATVSPKSTTDLRYPKPIRQQQAKIQSPPSIVASSSGLQLSKSVPMVVQPLINAASSTINSPEKSCPKGKKTKDADITLECTVCNVSGSTQNLVMCDECKRSYHFTCLEPPVEKSPKRRGYSWHCADCDPSASEPEE